MFAQPSPTPSSRNLAFTSGSFAAAVGSRMMAPKQPLCRNKQNRQNRPNSRLFTLRGLCPSQGWEAGGGPRSQPSPGKAGRQPPEEDVDRTKGPAGG